MPYDEWEAFYEIFPSEYRGLGAGGRGYASPIDAPTPGDAVGYGGAATGPPYGRPRRSGRKLLLGLVVLAVAAAVVVACVPGAEQADPRALRRLDHRDRHLPPLSKGTLTVTINEKGNLESAKNEDVLCEVEGSTTDHLHPARGDSKVKKGDKVCELDSATLKDNLKNQQITTQQAEASFEQARLTREVAEVAVNEYEQGTYKQDIRDDPGRHRHGQGRRSRAPRTGSSGPRRCGEKGYVSEAQKASDKLSLDKAKFTLEQAQTSIDVLEKYTRDKTIKELQAEVEKAHSDELAKKATLALEKDKEAKLVRQIEHCILHRPRRRPGRLRQRPGPVRRRATRCRSRKGRRSASGRRSSACRTSPRCGSTPRSTSRWSTGSARASGPRSASTPSPAQELDGIVQTVAPLPDPNTFFGSDIKVYTTQVAIENGPPGLRPGMSAMVQILVEQKPDVLSVPVDGDPRVQGEGLRLRPQARGRLRPPRGHAGDLRRQGRRDQEGARTRVSMVVH